MAVKKVIEEEPKVPPLTDDEIVILRWEIFGKCPVCERYVKGWNPGPFHAERYTYFAEHGIDAVSGHSTDCTEKWRKM